MYLNSQIIEKLQSAQWLISASLIEFSQLEGPARASFIDPANLCP
jgi:hypothetical protein